MLSFMVVTPVFAFRSDRFYIWDLGIAILETMDSMDLNVGGEGGTSIITNFEESMKGEHSQQRSTIL